MPPSYTCFMSEFSVCFLCIWHGLQDERRLRTAASSFVKLPTICLYLASMVYAREAWWRVLRQIHLEWFAPTDAEDLRTWCGGSGRRRWFRSPDVAWKLWKEINRRVFEGVCVQAAMLVEQIAEEGNSWINAGFSA